MRRLALPCLLALAACDNLKDFRQCAAVPADRLAQLPQRLDETGYGGPGAEPYAPQFELWSDGAAKRRWIALPEGERIDTTDMDFWQFPRGTRLWKEFEFGGRKVETRLLQKVGDGPDDWAMVSYVWNAEGTEALRAPDGAANALGSGHDVPSASQCWGCHGGTRSHVLGFSAVQLAESPTAQLDLEALERRRLLTRDPPAIPRVPGTPRERAALGYLHANCGHCHNQDRPPEGELRCYDPLQGFDLLLRVGQLADVGATPTYRTAVGDIVKPGKPDSSQMIQKVSRTSAEGGMPPLAKQVVHDQGVALLRDWIAHLPAN